MKKLYLGLAAVALTASAAFAQVENPVLPTKATFTPGTTDPEEPFEISDVNQTITVTFDSIPNVPVTVMYATGGGFGINVDYERINAVGNTVQIPMNRAKWGIPYNEVYNLHMVVTFTYDIVEDGQVIPEYYLDPSGNPVMFERTYYSLDKGAARLETTFPNNTMFEQGYTFAEAYEAGVMYAYFSKPVTAPENVALVTYYYGEDEINSFEATVMSQEWSEMDGLYQILFAIASPDFSAEDISRIDVQLNPVTWYNEETKKDELITSELITLINSDAAPQAAPRKVKKGIANGLAVGTESVNVYNLQGMLVVKNASNEDVKNLAPGMYIINGKKVVVK